jgi:hypothetical protein
MMSPKDTRALMTALHTNDHAHLGIRPADATPAESPCVLMGGATANDLSYALVTAGQVWPDCEDWALIGSDEVEQLASPGDVPTMHALRSPDTLATFATT